MDIKVSKGSNKLELISTNEMEYEQCLPWQEVKTQIWRSTWSIHQQSRPTLNSLDLQ